MAIVRTNTVTQSIAPESVVGTKPTTGVDILQPNTISDVGAEIDTVVRTPISRNRMPEAGSPTGLSSKATFDGDLTMHHARVLLPAIFFANPNGPTEGLADGAPFRPTAVTTTGYTVAAGGDIPDGYLVRAKGFAVAGNNGVKVTAGTSTATEVKAAGLAAETTTVAQGALLEICGVQGAAGDIELDGSGDLISTVFDFTGLGLTVGQYIHVGDDSAAAYRFATAAYYGYARVAAVTANKITLLDRDWTVGAADNGATKTIRILFGNFIRNVTTSDADWNFQSYTIETELPEIAGDDYIYQVGNYFDELAISVPVKNKVTIKAGTVGTDTEAPQARVANWSDGRTPVEVTLFNTTTDVARIKVAEAGTELTAYWKSFTISFKNELSPLEVIGVMGALDVNYGFFRPSVEGQALLTDGDLIAAVRDNTSLEFSFALANEDGGLLVHMPTVKPSNGKPEMPVNEEVLTNIVLNAVRDTTLGYVCSVSTFAYAPGIE